MRKALVLVFVTLTALLAQYTPPSGGSSGGMTVISDQVLTSPAATVTFSSIPGNYIELYLVGQARSDAAVTTLAANLQFNGDTGTNYEYFNVNGNANSNNAGQTAIGVSIINGASMTANVPGDFQAHIVNYSGTTFFKSVLSSNGGRLNATPTQYVSYIHGAWLNTAAITSISITASSGNFVTGSRFTLWGQK